MDLLEFTRVVSITSNMYVDLKELSMPAIMSILSGILYRASNDKNLDFEIVLKEFYRANLKVSKELS